MQPWQQFYEMLGGAAATLLGLLFVAVSMNAELILSGAHQHSRRLAEQAFQNYLAVLVVSLFVEMPGTGPQSFGSTLLIISGGWGAWAVWRLRTVILKPFSRDMQQAPARRYLATLAGFGLLVFAAWRMMHGGDYALYVAMGTLLLLVSATIASWELLVKVAEERYRGPDDPSRAKGP
jgi:hypothetical protein